MKAKSFIQLVHSFEQPRVIVILLVLIFISATCFAQEDKSSIDSRQYYSLEDEITLLNQSMKLRVTVDILAVGNEETIGILGPNQSGMLVTLSFENKDTINIRWTLHIGSKPKDSELILVVNGGKEITPIAEKTGDQKALIIPKYNQVGIAGLLYTRSTNPGENTDMMFLFSKPKNLSNAYLQIRQRISGMSGYEPLFTKEGIGVRINLADKY